MSTLRRDLICFSHLRWDFVYQRPNHLMARAARDRRVFFVEEPLIGAFAPSLRVERQANGVRVCLPFLPENLSEAEAEQHLEQIVRQLVRDEGIHRPIAWYYTPMALAFTRWLQAEVTVYDAMDELTGFLGAPLRLSALETELLDRADVVFTGGHSLYQAKRDRHRNVHAVPSAVDAEHFAAARHHLPEPADQALLPRPRIGWFGVIDERMDLPQLGAVAERHPDWSFVLVGPIVKIEPAALPQLPNLHYLGPRPYAELPGFIASWDVAMMPFARNAATRYISPTKTLEYLAAGRRVVSTSIRDVITPYGDEGVVAIADTPDEFGAAIGAALEANAREPLHQEWLKRVDAILGRTSWDTTWARMERLVEEAAPDDETRIPRGRHVTIPVATAQPSMSDLVAELGRD